MNTTKLETMLLGARPTSKKANQFTQAVMRQIQDDATFSKQLRTTSKQSKRSLLMKLRTLHGVSLGVALVITATLLTGVVYAGIRFAPDLIQLLDKRTNEQGRIEYSVPAFASCQSDSQPKADTFAVKPNATMGDEEIKKIIQAKCELQNINNFASQTWPTYGQHKQWRTGDTIYYTRPDILGTIKSVDKHKLIIEYGSLKDTKTYQTFEGKDLLAFYRNQKVSLDSVKPGDFVFTIERVSETYHASLNEKTNPNPKAVGIVAIVKMTLPQDYYGAKQDTIYEIQPCMNNSGETCPKEYPGGIDVFPRGSEAAVNPDLTPATATTILRDINGVVTDISGDAVTIKSNKGNAFTIHIDRQIIDSYNQDAPKLHSPKNDSEQAKVTLHPGSWVSVTYLQEANSDPRTISQAHIFKLFLLIDLSPKNT